MTIYSWIGKTMERIVLNRLVYKLLTPHLHLVAFDKRIGTADNIATLRSLLEVKNSIIVMLDLEKAFELVDPTAVSSILVDHEIKGHLLSWAND